MVPAVKLGGCKLLKDAFCFSIVQRREKAGLLAEFCQAAAFEKVNLPLFTFGSTGPEYWANIVAERGAESKTLTLISRIFGKSQEGIGCSILSLFPHRHNPSIAGTLIGAVESQTTCLPWFAHSNSAISVIMGEDEVERLTEALFGCFHFGPYRTPVEWKSAQKGKEKIFKEVVASYQERVPKVYGLGWQNRLKLIDIPMGRETLPRIAAALQDLAGRGSHLRFIISGPFVMQGGARLSICLPEEVSGLEIEKIVPPGISTLEFSPVSIFSMNGPHFSDRYGIVSNLLLSFMLSGIRLLALSCAVSSISGVVPADQLPSATLLIQECFEVPSITGIE